MNEAERKNERTMSQRKRILIFLLSSFAALAICMGTVVFVTLSLVTEGTEQGDTPVVALTPCPDSREKTLRYMKRITSNANDNDVVFADVSETVNIDENSISFSGTEAERNILKYMKGKIQASLDAMYGEDEKGAFGKGYTDFPRIDLTPEELTGFACDQIDYSGEDGAETEPCYSCRITFKPVGYPMTPGSGAYTTFRLKNAEEIPNMVREAFKDVLTVDSFSARPTEYAVQTVSAIETDLIRELQLTRNYQIALGFTFIGEYASLGTRHIVFDYEASEKFVYFWAGIKFTENSVTLTAGENVQLPVEAMLNKDLTEGKDYKVIFRSSDESIAAVDKLGYVTGVKNSAKAVTVTVEMDYLGHQYKSECTVLVRNSVAQLKISKDKITLKTGGIYQLSASVKPKNATVKDVEYKSSDEKIATVDSSGKVTAHAPGEVKITAVSVDGRFLDSCAVTVVKGGTAQ